MTDKMDSYKQDLDLTHNVSLEPIHYKGIIEPKVNLFFNWYESPTRQHEIDECLHKNKELFDEVIVVYGRPTFKELFELTKEYPNDINCFCNSDIYLTDLTRIKQIKANECYAVTRADLLNDPNAVGSQDAWVFKGVIKPIDADFTLGKWGSDNRVAYEIQKAGYDIKNPSLSINLVHLHEIDNRIWNPEERKRNTIKPPYLTLQPIK